MELPVCMKIIVTAMIVMFVSLFGMVQNTDNDFRGRVFTGLWWGSVVTIAGGMIYMLWSY